MRELRHRIRRLIARLRAGEGAHVLADLGETAEHWLRSGPPLPALLRGPLEQIGGALGELARSYRPAPHDVPPPPEPERRSEAPVRTPFAVQEAPEPRVEIAEAESAGARVSARRAPVRKPRTEPPPPVPAGETPKRRKGNGKARERRPSARRAKPDDPT